MINGMRKHGACRYLMEVEVDKDFHRFLVQTFCAAGGASRGEYHLPAGSAAPRMGRIVAVKAVPFFRQTRSFEKRIILKRPGHPGVEIIGLED